MAGGDGGGLATVFGAELAQDVGDVELDGAGAADSDNANTHATSPGDTNANASKTDGSKSGNAKENDAGTYKSTPARELAALYEEQLPAGAGEQAGNEELPPGDSNTADEPAALQPDSAAIAGTTGATVAHGALLPLPPDWPDERGFVPAPPSPVRPSCCPSNGPVMTHTRIYHGTDGDFTEALASYYHFRDDARFGGWQNYLQRSDDFIRFCCHMHIAEMLSARGGAGQTRVRHDDHAVRGRPG